jgi:hypothetical protein
MIGGKIMKLFWLLGLMIVIVANISLNGCARVPMKVDQSTFLKYEKIYEDQAKKSNHPLLGTWRITFAANKKTTSQSDGYYSIGEIIFVAIKRGASIDFICTSYFGDFGDISDQGPTHTLNFNGSAFWSFSEKTLETNMYSGKLSGILGSRGKAEAMLSQDKQQLMIYEYPEPADGSTQENPRVMTTTMVVGGPLIERLEHGTIATIFFERRSR